MVSACVRTSGTRHRSLIPCFHELLQVGSSIKDIVTKAEAGELRPQEESEEDVVEADHLVGFLPTPVYATLMQLLY